MFALRVHNLRKQYKKETKRTEKKRIVLRCLTDFSKFSIYFFCSPKLSYYQLYTRRMFFLKYLVHEYFGLRRIYAGLSVGRKQARQFASLSWILTIFAVDASTKN